MTIEQKIAKDIIKDDMVLFYQSLWGIYDLSHSLMCQLCYNDGLDVKLLDVELEKLCLIKLISSTQCKQLKIMIKSKNSSDADLARQLIDNLRTERLRNANRKSNRKTKSNG